MSDSARAARSRTTRAVAAVAAIVAVAVLTLGPRALVAPARGEFMRLMDVVTAPLLVWIPYGDAERILNTLLFVPLGATIALLLRKRYWVLAVLAGLALSAAVEYAQASIPGRVPDPEDVFWNTAGAVIGVVAVTICRLTVSAVEAIRRASTRAARSAAGR
ncbi:VanZ family protein [Microbacterium sulfonylureivorans]|uniref:VanZ family protein n=1 Tax=Microbacterium sulfonylureivorans TaxID=2486854 RepID=UPI000FDB28D9|nr:VanZ family protein [Microbacterium sulfonylureivorans]